MFGFGKSTCVLCDHRVPNREAFAVRHRKGFAVCRRCVEQWQGKGGLCPKCSAPLQGPQDVGIFLEGKRTFGHADCGALPLIAA